MESVKTNSLCLPFSRLSVVDILGHGSFGRVQLVKEKTKGGVAALKTIPKESLSKYMIEIQKQNVDSDNNKTLGKKALKEITAMKRVCTGQCSGIPRYVGDREDKDNYYILMDSVKGKSLRTIINEMGPFTDINTVRSILAQILSTISFIHSQNVLHRDLSDNNILIQPNGTVKIIDFGCATLFDPNRIPDCSPYTEYPEIDPDDINKKNIIGTLDFIAPESLVDNYYSEKSDIWSFGVLLFFMVTGHYPFSDDEIDDVYETMYNILENNVIFYEEDEIYDPLYDIFYSCCNPDINTRISVEELKNHEFFDGIDWNVITMPKRKMKPNLSVHTSLLKNNVNASLLNNSNSNNNMGPNQIYIASPTCLNSPLRISSPSCLYTPLSCGYNTPPIENSRSPVHTPNSPKIKHSNSILVSSSPLINASTIETTPKIKPNSPAINLNHDFQDEIQIFSPKATRQSNISKINNILNKHNNYNNNPNTNTNTNTNTNIINNITPKRPVICGNKSFLKEEYVNSPLQQQSTLFTQKSEIQDIIEDPIYQSIPSPAIFRSSTPNTLDDPIYQSIPSPAIFRSSTPSALDNELNISNSIKRKNILFANNESKNNELISEVVLNNSNLKITLNNSESSLNHKTKSYNKISTSESSDDESSCTLANESEKEFSDQSPLMEENTLILNHVVNDPSNSNIYKTWDSENSHILTF